MELFDKIVTQRITQLGQLSEAERAAVLADPELAQLIEHNAELTGASASMPLPPEMSAMLHRVRLAESISRPPAKVGWLEQIFGQGWQYKSVGSLAAVAVAIAALYAVPSMLSGNRLPQQNQNGNNVISAAEQQRLLAGSSVGTWLEYSVGDDLSEPERELLHEKLQLAVADNSSDIEQEPVVRLLADGSAYSVYVPALASDDSRIDAIDNSIRRVERFSLERRSNRLFVEGANPGGDIRVIRSGNSDIAFPTGLSDQQLVGVLEAVAPALPQSGLPSDPQGISTIVHEGFRSAGYDGSWLDMPDTRSGTYANAQPGISEQDIRAVNDFEKLELRLGQRLEHSLELYQLSDEQIEQYRSDLQHELELHLLLPSNWDGMERSELDGFVYARMLMQCRSLGIDTIEFKRDRISVSVNDEPADSEELPADPQRMLVELK
ncbi:hypothetical protein KDL29_03320 [bacterium]|nr:hypothetical protein [bacterium]